MPRNPNGEYVLPSIYLAASGQTIRADQHNIPMQDIAQALTGSVARNGSAPMTNNLPMGGNRITGLAPATAASDAVRLDQVTKYSGFLNAVSNLAMAANEIPYATGVSAAAKTALTPYARSLLAAADAAAARTALSLGAVATDSVVPVSRGGTGGTTQSAARLGLGLGNVSTQNTLDINGAFLTGTLSVAGGGTGATNAASARLNLGLGSIATQSSIDNANWNTGGADLAIVNGGTGASTASAARLNLGLNSGAEMAIATQAEAVAGSANNVIMTPLRSDQVMQAKAIGWGQSWQDVTASRVAGTAYRNTTGRPIIVSVTADASANNQGLRVSTDGTNYVPVGYFPNSGGSSCCIQAVVAHNEYYRVDTGLDGLSIWSERR